MSALQHCSVSSLLEVTPWRPPCFLRRIRQVPSQLLWRLRPYRRCSRCPGLSVTHSQRRRVPGQDPRLDMRHRDLGQRGREVASGVTPTPWADRYVCSIMYGA
jgi:hypothetical protein